MACILKRAIKTCAVSAHANGSQLQQLQLSCFSELHAEWTSDSLGLQSLPEAASNNFMLGLDVVEVRQGSAQIACHAICSTGQMVSHLQ